MESWCFLYSEFCCCLVVRFNAFPFISVLSVSFSQERKSSLHLTINRTILIYFPGLINQRVEQKILTWQTSNFLYTLQAPSNCLYQHWIGFGVVLIQLSYRNEWMFGGLDIFSLAVDIVQSRRMESVKDVQSVERRETAVAAACSCRCSVRVHVRASQGWGHFRRAPYFRHICRTLPPRRSYNTSPPLVRSAYTGALPIST